MEIVWSQTIIGQPYSKANHRGYKKAQSRFGREYLQNVKSTQALGYQNDFLAQICPKLQSPIDYDIILFCDIFYKSRRPDLDESLIMDCLQKAGIIQNDRLIKEKHIYWNLDPKNPRAQISLVRLDTTHDRYYPTKKA